MLQAAKLTFRPGNCAELHVRMQDSQRAQTLDQTNKQAMKTPHFAPYGQWTYKWRPYKQTNTIWHVELPYLKPTSNLTFRPRKQAPRK